MTLNEIDCCGVRAFEGLYSNSPHSIIDYIAEDRFEYDEYNRYSDDAQKYRFVIFTDTSHKQSRLKAMMDFIKVNKLGSTVKTKPRINPNTGNVLQVCVWTINDTKLKAWFKKHCI